MVRLTCEQGFDGHPCQEKSEQILAVDEALDRLVAVNLQAGELVKLRYFASCTNTEAASLLGASSTQSPDLIGFACWKHPVGPGWSSCAVVGDFLYTQEQRRDEEVTVCYQVADGLEVWKHAVSTRFEEATGDGPRATPTFHEDRLYVLGATGVKQQWLSPRMKLYYNDMVSLGQYACALENGVLLCLDLETGERVWKEGRYHPGQLLLLEEQGLLLIQGERGVVALVTASPYGLDEIARFQLLKGITWNHPVVAQGKLFVRNSEEMACYDVSPDAE
jgi:outer membrane protein assembly factor BamB